MEDALCTFLRIAKIESQKSLAPYKLGCVIARKRKILGRGYNVYKTHPKLGVGYHGFFHAETKAIQDALSRGHDLEGATAYIYREGGLLAKPCVHCQRILYRPHPGQMCRYIVSTCLCRFPQPNRLSRAY